MKNTEIYTDKYGNISTLKLDKIIDAARNHISKNFRGYHVNGITFGDFLQTKRMRDLKNRFEIEVNRIGANYTFGDATC
jgi:hypothetical protein